ncbi:MAG TPA: hypothetical protein PLM00_07150 [Spirochaetota bacterium]|nr:hypothetical protein [Spirochaetota bacterium]HPN83154.1 hypothetical protein [Spirochaetota bacterium]
MKKSLFSALILVVLLVATNCSIGPDVVGVSDFESRAVTTLNGSAAPAYHNQSDRIRIASFNIQIFGTTKAARANVIWTLAHIATRYDIIAVQEVGSNGTPSETTATSVMNTYVAKINSIAGSGAYSYVRGHQYAFVYRNATITKKASGLYSGSKTFTYKPLRANFAVKNGTFDFAMLTIHTSPDKAVTEIPALQTAMSETRTYYNEQDVICLGDYNADGSYFSAGAAGGSLNGWSTTTYITVVKNGVDTTVSTGNSYTYDRMQIYKGASYQDYTGYTGVLKFASYYKVSMLEGTTTTAGKESALSDHYPIFADFRKSADTN